VWTLIPGVPIGCRSPRKRGPYSTPIHTLGSVFDADNPSALWREVFRKTRLAFAVIRLRTARDHSFLTSRSLIRPGGGASGGRGCSKIWQIDAATRFAEFTARLCAPEAVIGEPIQ
jgi:hypothetical protein